MLDKIIVKMFYHSIPPTQALQKGNLRRVSSCDRFENRFSQKKTSSTHMTFIFFLKSELWIKPKGLESKL